MKAILKSALINAGLFVSTFAIVQVAVVLIRLMLLLILPWGDTVGVQVFSVLLSIVLGFVSLYAYNEKGEN